MNMKMFNFLSTLFSNKDIIYHDKAQSWLIQKLSFFCAIFKEVDEARHVSPFLFGKARAMSRISGLRNDMFKKTFYKQRKSTIDILIS